MNDAAFMGRAILLASRAKGLTSPNPLVGALLVRKGRIIAEDYHRKAGTPHAEALVIEKAGNKAASSTLYVNLEPCCHTDKRTPPCTRAIIRAGIKRVVVAMEDPNPRVSEKGIRELKDHGVEVLTGILREKAQRLNESYVKYITTRKPFVVLKVAMTLDGKIATQEGQSKWITGERARRVVHRLRSSVDAVMTAIGTVKADDPELTSRIRGGRNPKRIVIDPDLETPLGSKILRVPPETIIVSRDESAHDPLFKEKVYNIEKSGGLLILFKDKLKLSWLMEQIGKMDITSLMIEGGSSLNAHAIDEGVVDKVMFFIAPKILGGTQSFPAVGGKTLRLLEEAHRLQNITVKRVGDDLLVEGYL